MAEPPAEILIAPVAGPASDGRLSRRALGTSAIAFMVLAAAAPMAVVVATMPIAFALGNGAGLVGTFLLVGIAMGLFAIGYVRLLPKVRNAGAFYAIITLAFGRPLGLGAAYVALACYMALCCATLGAFAYFFADFIYQVLGLQVHWAAIAIVTIGVLAILSYFRISLTAKILEVALTAEVLVILALDIAILFERHGALSVASVFSPQVVFAPGLGIAAIYGFNSCIGFEGTAIYQEEARDPDRSIPRATFVAIAIVAIFYVLTAWCFVLGVDSDVSAVAGKDPGHFVFMLADRYLGSAGERILSALVITSAFAAVLGLFNNSARYLFALARDRALPSLAARTHPVYGSPIYAGLPILVLLTIVVLSFALAGADPLLVLTTSLTGLGSVGLMALLAATAFAVPACFLRGGLQTALLPAVIAPFAGGIMISTGVVLSIGNYRALTGSESAWVNNMPWLLPMLAIAGIGQAAWLRRAAPALYSRIGSSRIENE